MAIRGWATGVRLSLELTGWAQDIADPGNPLLVTVSDGGRRLGGQQLDPPARAGQCHFAVALHDLPLGDALSVLATDRLQVLANGVPLHVSSAIRTQVQDSGLLSPAAAPGPAPGPAPPAGPSPASPAMSSLALPVGYTSSNGVSILGRDGTLFLLAGSNDLISQYAVGLDSPELRASSEAWHALIRDRADRLAGSCRFVMMLIPEKTSALAHLFPVAIQPPTALYRAVRDRAAADPALLFVDCMPVLAGRPEFFPRLDSHLSSRGCHAVFQEVLRQLGLPPMDELRFGTQGECLGDLGLHLLGGPVAEPLPDEVDPDQAAIPDDGLELVEEVTGSSQIGTRMVWRNPSAPYRLKVVAFANSFFDTGRSPGRLSWWFSRWFAEFHFIWSPALDDDYVRTVQPDIVVAQTIERFLARTPER